MSRNHFRFNFQTSKCAGVSDLKHYAEEDLYAGFVCFVPPVRDKSSKFFVTFEEYEYNMFPPFINAGAYVISSKTIRKLYLASHFVKMFRFDDVFVFTKCSGKCFFT